MEAMRARPKGHAAIAWFVFGAVAACIAAMNALPDDAEAGEDASAFAQELMGHYFVGARALMPSLSGSRFSPGEIGGDSVAARLRRAILEGEESGPDAARRVLDGITNAQGDDARARDALLRIYADYAQGRWDAPSADAAEREFLADRLGWFGRLALAPEAGDPAEREKAIAPARRTFAIALCGVAIGAFALILGIAFLLALLVLWGCGRITPKGGPPVEHHGVYMEAVAVWLVGFTALGLAARFIAAGGSAGIALAAGAMILSALAALAWPVLRGVPWEQVRADIGLGARAPFGSLLAGGVAWCAALPMVACGLCCAAAGSALVARAGAAGPVAPTHPIVPVLAEGGPLERILIWAIAAVMAPITEEIVFRGFLYRHLRDAPARRSPHARMVTAALLSGLVFAILHPQGILAIPALTALGMAFAFAREWSGSLLPAIAAHGLNNGLLVAWVMGLTGGAS
jgi:membrane protease YdiL (CAAX protease family)